MPLAMRVKVSANTITVTAMLLNIAASFMLAAARTQPRLLIMAALMIACAGLLDALDGMVARLRGQTTRLGDFLDHFFDRVSDLFILLGWTVGAAVRPLLAAITLLAVMLNGYISAQIEASFGRRSYGGTGRGEYVLAVTAIPLLQFAFVRSGLALDRVGGFTPAEWLTAAIAVFAVVGIVQRFGDALQLARRP